MGSRARGRISASTDAAAPARNDGYPLGRTTAWWIFGLTYLLMLLNYIDRQGVVALAIAAGGIPLGLLAPRCAASPW